MLIYLLLDTLPLEYTATPTRTRPPSYTDQPPPEYSNEPPPKYSDIHFYPSPDDFSGVSCEQARGQSRNTAISIISYPEEKRNITSSNANTGSFPIGHEHKGTSRVYTEALIGHRSTDTSSSADPGQNSTLSSRHGVNTVPHAAHWTYLEQHRTQLRVTAVRLTAQDSHGGNETELRCGNTIICMAVCALIWCPFAGIFAVYYVYRKHKFLARGERNKAKESERNAVFAILISISFFFVWFMPLFVAILKS